MVQTKLNDVAKLLDFGAHCLNAQKINVMKMRGARKTVFPMIVAAHNYSEGVFVLCKANRTHPCFTLLRSLLENLINIKFLYCSPRKHFNIIFLNGLVEKKKQFNDTLDYFKKFPQYKKNLNFTDADVLKALDKLEIEEDNIRRKVDKSQEKFVKYLYDRAAYVDEHNQKKNQKSESLEWLYIHLFRTLSSSTHLNFLEFKNYFTQKDDEIVVFLSGNPDDTGDVLNLLHYLYKETLGTFLKIFKSPLKNKLKEFDLPP